MLNKGAADVQMSSKEGLVGLCESKNILEIIL